MPKEIYPLLLKLLSVWKGKTYKIRLKSIGRKSEYKVYKVYLSIKVQRYVKIKTKLDLGRKKLYWKILFQ